MEFFPPSSHAGSEPSDVALSELVPFDAPPPLGATPPQLLAEDAAAGRRGAAWRLLHWIMENDPRAVEAVSSLKDDRLAQNLLEFIALGTWAGKPFVVPPALRSSYTRTRLRTLFLPLAGMDTARSERVLLAALHDGRRVVRESAMYILGLIGTPAAIPALIAALHDPLSSTRHQAIKALGRSRSPEAVPALLGALHGSDELQGGLIFRALVNLGHRAVPALLDASQSASNWMRWHSIRALGEIRDRRAFPALVRALGDADHSVAWMAAKGLAPFGKICVEPVLRLLITADMTPWLAETAAYVLSQQYPGHADLKPYLDPVIQQMHRSFYKAGTGYTAQKALEQLQANGLLNEV